LAADTSPRVSAWQRWVELPHSLWFRRALYQVHLWVGIVIGLYVLMISVTGSLVVFRRELARWLLPPGRDPDAAFPLAMHVMEWLVDLHDNLLGGPLGRDINGIFAVLVTVLILSGAVIWWPGRQRWRRSVMPLPPSNTNRFSWHLHSALGLWGFALLISWAITGIYFAFPEPFEWFFNTYDTDPTDFERPGEEILLALIRWHFGRFGGITIRVLWVILGLIPAVLFITGFVVWWKRVAARTLRRIDVSSRPR
jgi:uncharacterized iron-regulated membrane protein